MIVGKLIGFLLLIVAAIAFVRDALDWYDSGLLETLSGDQLWLSLAPDAYQSVQYWIIDNLSYAWDPVATTILAVPAFISAGILGVLFLLASRKKRKRRAAPAAICAKSTADCHVRLPLDGGGREKLKTSSGWG